MEGPGLRIMTEKYSSAWMLLLRGGSCVVPGDMWHPGIPRRTGDELDDNRHRLYHLHACRAPHACVPATRPSGPRPQSERMSARTGRRKRFESRTKTLGCGNFPHLDYHGGQHRSRAPD
jgi:hypothetical protein